MTAPDDPGFFNYASYGFHAIPNVRTRVVMGPASGWAEADLVVP